MASTATADAQQQMQNSRGGFGTKTLQNQQSSLINNEFDRIIQEQEQDLQQYDPDNKDFLGNITDSLAFQIEERSLECRQLEENPIFQKLKLRLRQFFIAQEEYRRHGPNKQQLQFQAKSGVDFTYKIQLHRALKRLLREVILTKDKDGQMKNLGKVYAWYFGKLESIGQMSNQEKDEEEIFMNPGKIADIQRIKMERQEEKRSKLLDEELAEAKERKMYEEGERSIHHQIPPAKDRIADYKRKSFGKLFQNRLDDRPMSGVASSTGQLADVTTQAQSVFEEDEKSIYSHPFQKFYSTGEPVVFKNQNRFEGRSNYLNYYPTDNMVEQKLEKIWYNNQNRLVQEKRRDEELKQHVKEWSQAKSRIEIEIQRKKEHQNVGSNFEQARGFVRKNWKSKNFNPDHNPLLEESSTDSEDYGQEDHQAHEYNTQNKQESMKLDQTEIEEQEIAEDNEYDEEEDGEGGDSQLENMQRLQENNPLKGNRGAKSAHPRMRGKGYGQTQSTKVIDLTNDQLQYGIRPNTAIQIKQIAALNDYNKALPKRKQNEALPMIFGTNIGTSQIIKKDYKKKTTELITRYKPIGLIDDYLDPKEDQSSKYSMQGKVRTLSVQSAKKRLDDVRKYQGPLINANSSTDETNIDNIFVSSSKGNEAYTLSVYNRPDKSKRPMTAPTMQNNWFKKYQKLQPVPEEGEEQPFIDTRLPEFKEPKGVNIMSRGQVDGYRLEQMNEIESIKERLARDGQTLSMVTLQRAILMPEEIEYKPGERKYPKPGEMLLPNPFPKKKKKKGKKKKKKSKK